MPFVKQVSLRNLSIKSFKYHLRQFAERFEEIKVLKVIDHNKLTETLVLDVAKLHN